MGHYARTQTKPTFYHVLPPFLLCLFHIHSRLNEGFTKFLERKIVGRRRGEKMVDFGYIGKSKHVQVNSC